METSHDDRQYSPAISIPHRPEALSAPAQGVMKERQSCTITRIERRQCIGYDEADGLMRTVWQEGKL